MADPLRHEDILTDHDLVVIAEKAGYLSLIKTVLDDPNGLGDPLKTVEVLEIIEPELEVALTMLPSDLREIIIQNNQARTEVLKEEE